MERALFLSSFHALAPSSFILVIVSIIKRYYTPPASTPVRPRRGRWWSSALSKSIQEQLNSREARKEAALLLGSGRLLRLLLLNFGGEELLSEAKLASLQLHLLLDLVLPLTDAEGAVGSFLERALGEEVATWAADVTCVFGE